MNTRAAEEPTQLTLCEILPPEAKESKRWPGIYVTPDGEHVYRYGPGRAGLRHRWLEFRRYYDSTGYRQLGFSRDGQLIMLKVHWLVMDAFGTPKPSDSHQIRHLNGNRRDNRIENLAWGTHRENYEDSVRHGTAIAQQPRWAEISARGRAARAQKRQERLEAAKTESEERRRPGASA